MVGSDSAAGLQLRIGGSGYPPISMPLKPPLVSFQKLALYDDLIPLRVKGSEMADWLQGRGLPPAPVLKTKILLPNLSQVNALIATLDDAVPSLDGREKPTANLWRRIVLGIPGSQLLDKGGTLPTSSVIWSNPRRIRAKEDSSGLVLSDSSDCFLQGIP